MKTSTTSTAQTADSKSLSNIRFITITALFIALTYVFTAFINIRLPITANGGLIHLGNVPLFICAIIFALRLDCMGSIHTDHCRSDGICRRCHHRKTSRLWLEHTCDRSCMRDQSRWLLHCRGYHLRKLDCTGYFHSWKPCPDRCCCCHRSFDRRQLQKIVNKML